MTEPTKNQSLRRVATAAAWTLFVCLGAATGVFFVRAWQDYQLLRAQETTMATRLAKAEAQLKDQERVLQRLRTDPAYVERVIRRKLGYARADEFVFRFED